MRIPPYWAVGKYTEVDSRGYEHMFQAYGWSFSSLEAARADGAARARKACERISRQQTIESYDYCQRPLREEIIENVRIKDEVVAIITRNRYGALVLNSASVLFADVDVAAPKPSSFWEAIRLMFSPGKRRQSQADARQDTHEALSRWAQSNTGHSLRLYSTAAGFRLLFTDGRYNPKDAKTEAIFQSLGCDPMYRRLCKAQECFRARLTPKPWRCGHDRPPYRYPWRDADVERIARQWEQQYAELSKPFATCKLLEVMGDNPHDEEINKIIDLHDRHTCNSQCEQLA